MAVLSNTGAHCGVKECSRLDFLPFTCSQCRGVFCLDHFRYEAHQCPLAAGLDNRVLVCPLCDKGVRLEVGEDPNLTWERHTLNGCTNPAGAESRQKKARCPVRGCKELLTASNTVLCARCGQKVCLKHRFEDAHGCGTAPSRARRAADTWRCGRCTLVNAAGVLECAACGEPASQMLVGNWTCNRCTLDNGATCSTCVACGASRSTAGDSGQAVADWLRFSDLKEVTNSTVCCGDCGGGRPDSVCGIGSKRVPTQCMF
ncbi:unnamed protein product [Durusdinium trenchii]|uniref:Uncharacterized protein n=1 Tax=Durusdinium trenchii TaxID=1381693 RepID=A0ABP0NRY9_9DINO